MKRAGVGDAPKAALSAVVTDQEGPCARLLGVGGAEHVRAYGLRS